MGTASDRNPDQRPPDPVAAALADEFENVVKPRRAAAGIDADDRGGWALALSGGGIRSATFCLGLIRGLAKNNMLREFDYLSTVSGGGYIGASLGRLYGAANGSGERAGAAEVEGGVASDRSMWLWWLRNNGRYLTPAGAKDLSFATASIVRGVIATNLEIGILLLLLAGVVLLPHVLVYAAPPQPSLASWWSQDFAQLTDSAWWWLLPLPLFAFVHQVIAYWYTRESHSVRSVLLIVAAAFLSMAAALQLFENGSAALDTGMQAAEQFHPARTVASFLAGFLLLAPATAWVASWIDWLRKTPVGEVRLKRTKRQAYAMWTMAVVVAIALLDATSWWLTRLLLWQGPGPLPLGRTALIGLLLVAGRFVVPEIQKRLAATKKPNLNVEKLLNVFGLLIAIATLVFWTTAFNVFLFAWTRWDTPLPPGPAWTFSPAVNWATVVGTCLLYTFFTCRSFELLNLASLHNFYRARIERAYVSSGNAGTDAARFPDSALAEASEVRTMRVAPLMETIAGDDVDLTAYQPHRHGGPIHLVNCCINQSVDDRTGIYNADRKGVALTVSALGAEIGAHFAAPGGFAQSPGKLSRWIAISGAATSTGMGSRTSPGFATLLFMTGVRLGYWIRSLAPPRCPQRNPPGWLRAWLVAQMPKPLAIVAESIARFPGPFGPVWYVSDGGHYDNTGIYALLKRKPRLIVAADCGADPKYLFADLESLVRKAKIDYDASIEFVEPQRVQEEAPNAFKCQLGTPESITPEAGTRWLVLGRIRYADGSHGALLLVKPRRLDRMPFDIVAYADRNPDFPQQTTGDQFFDEAQWEAYHQLGLTLGRRIDRHALESALSIVDEKPFTSSSLAAAQAGSEAPEPKESRRSRVGLTVQASLGAGISLSLILALWQGFEQFRETRLLEQKEYDARYGELAAQIGERDKLRKLRVEDFRPFAKLSESRDDGRFEYLRKLVNDACAALPVDAAPAESRHCFDLHEEMALAPPVRYDYWFLDRPLDTAVDTAVAAATPAADAAAPTGAPASEPATAPPPAPSAAMPTAAPAPAAPAPQEPAAAPQVSLPPVEAMACDAVDGIRPRVYIHIYDEASRKPADVLAYRLQARLGIEPQPVENVVRAANRTSKAAPFVWTTPALVNHGGVSEPCIKAIRAATGGVMRSSRVVIRPLPSSYKPNPGMVEVWLPPAKE